MPCHPVPRQRSHHHHLPTLTALYPSLQSLPVGGSLSLHTSPVHRLRLVPRRLAWASDYADCIPGISLQAHPIQQAEQGTKCTLDPSWVQRCNHAIVRVEEVVMMPTLLSTLSLLLCVLYHHRQSVYNHCIHHQIENGGVERISLCHYTSSLKCRPVVAAHPCRHC